ncbi:helix-turn-helix domain-containing protein [Streptomyces avidinii]|uniref:helix-turn-helix domain-containing protein n=1 Tax=Streptomyces avidinii TaxID=1895 RepID=UPI00386C0F4C|nr:helix-turn-helix domain-containing protein [Streptomyces avidinii]
MRTCIIALISVMMWSVAAKMRCRKILTHVAIIATASVRIMTTGRIELGPTGRAVAANVKRLRTARGLSLRALSDALGRAGRSLSADALNKIENGASDESKQIRRTDVDDVMALAVVFGVSPSALLLPLDDSPTGTVEITGVGEYPADAAWDWADGKRPMQQEGDDTDTDALEYHRLSRPPRRRRAEQLAHIRATMREIEEAEAGDG